MKKSKQLKQIKKVINSESSSTEDQKKSFSDEQQICVDYYDMEFCMS